MGMRCRITSGGGDPRESATENRPPRPLPCPPRMRGEHTNPPSRGGGWGEGAAARVKRCGKSAPRLRQHKRHGKPHREQNRIGTAWSRGVAQAAAVLQDRCPGPAVRVGCSKRRATGVPEEWPSRAGPRPAPHRTRLTGRLMRGPAPQAPGLPPFSVPGQFTSPDLMARPQEVCSHLKADGRPFFLRTPPSAGANRHVARAAPPLRPPPRPGRY
jgi:hypothetical protein